MKKIILLFLSLFVFFTITSPVSAVELEGVKERSIKGSNCTYNDPELGEIVTLDCVPILVFNGIYWLLVFAGVVALFLIIFGGFRFMTSGGDPKGVEEARKIITWAIVGLVVVLLSFAIVAFVAYVTNAGCITRFGFQACSYGGGGGGAGGGSLIFPI